MLIDYFFFLISKLRNILTKKGQALEYTWSIQRNEKQKRDELRDIYQPPKTKAARRTREYI